MVSVTQLIVITGYPCSGKTYRAQQLASALEERIAGTHKSKLTVLHIQSYHSYSSQLSNSEDCPTRDSIYNSAAVEKTARAAELSAIKRALSKDAIVIADDLNYIKGFRYQLWCEAKAAGTRCCTVHCAAREKEVDDWNRFRLRKWGRLTGQSLREEEGAMVADGHVSTADAMGIGALPESHTAIYGDRIPTVSSKSRSSSMDANDGDETFARPIAFIEESLKSFSLADQSPVTVDEMTERNGNVSTAATKIEFRPPSSPPYSSETLRSLLMRYEPPSPFTKWDTPLFTVPASDRLPPISAIWDALFPPTAAKSTRTSEVSESREAEVKPHAATALPQATAADALQMQERITSGVVAQIMAQVKQRPELSDEGGEVQVRFVDTVGMLVVPAGTVLSLPMMQRLRRRFTQIQRGGIAHGRGHVKGEKAVGESFLRFLNGEMES